MKQRTLSETAKKANAARNRNMSPKQRSASARHAAKARWSKKK